MLGERLRKGLDQAAANHGFALRQTGPAQMPLIMFDEDPDFGRGYLWGSALVKRGVYVHPWHNMFLCAAMNETDIDQALDAADGAFKTLKSRAANLAPLEKMSFLAA